VPPYHAVDDIELVHRCPEQFGGQTRPAGEHAAAPSGKLGEQRYSVIHSARRVMLAVQAQGMRIDYSDHRVRLCDQQRPLAQAEAIPSQYPDIKVELMLDNGGIRGWATFPVAR